MFKMLPCVGAFFLLNKKELCYNEKLSKETVMSKPVKMTTKNTKEKRMLKFASKADFVVENNQIDWASDYTKEMINLTDIIVKDVMKSLKNIDCSDMDEKIVKQLKKRMK